ncbi:MULTISPECIES: hypothetical protein [Empedobacter]|jgi:uncharacterized membrane protein YecN with MAPEG domain|uniref:Cytochrome B n=1 Tax=Empedobacter falsenii TaxID=343874 RepID=A0A427BQK6_9FLAO|nr:MULTISPECIES: hypothetical protein [Empedobacter]HAR74499.1 hypothetical protein [Flavobacteriaceae bacterium]MBY0067604.1 hypothetical protein [Empedobacter falsenii]MDH0658900.1 hypothetical protein [Empedobacter sp. GD03865]MDH0673167.1 hypothetical protein [Empedobacter sp. GD03861]MDH1603630.1 hypothetical protein [Empedobacter sp. GD03739]
MDFIKQFHSGWAYLVILMGVIFVISTLIYAISKKDTNATIKKIGLFTTITFHVQLLLGLVYYIMMFSALEPSGIMKDSGLRLTFVEHPMMMIAGVVFMTIANAKLKRSTTVPMSVAVFAIIGLVCILSRIPYHVWFA